MARKYYTPIDLNGLEIQNVKFQNLASAPTARGVGHVYYNTTSNTLFVYDGAAWQAAGKVAAGVQSSRPAAGSVGRLYFATDTLVMFYDSGTDWSQIGVKQSDVDALAGRVTTAEGSIVSIDGRVSTAETTLNSHGGRLTTVEGDVVALEGRMTTAEGGINALDTRTSTNETDIAGLKGRATTIEGRLDTHDTHFTSVDSTLSSQGTRLTTAEGNVTALENRAQGIEDAATALTSRVTTAEGNITGLRTDLTSTQGDVSGLRSDLNNLSGAWGARTLQSTPVAASTDLSLSGNKITNLAEPVSSSDAATKGYVDGLAMGLDVKASVRAATTENITLTGLTTVDGVSLADGDRVLVMNQTTGTQNGIYVVRTGSWVRATDADANAEVTSGLFTFVEEGTLHANSGWVLGTANPISVGQTALDFVQFSGAGQITAGDGMVKVGSTLAVGAGTGLVANPDNIAIDTTVVARKVTFDTFAVTVSGASYDKVLTHNLGNRDVSVQIYDATSYATVECDVIRNSANEVTVTFALSGSFRAVVVG